MPIRKLSTLLINQIAAGEVIERPASVVKELLENSLDAGATRIDITIEEGGTQLIRIADDGCGIDPDELTLAVAPHATSKLQTTEDLDAIQTLGFRGEALASIASVSRLRLSSVSQTGSGQIEVAGDQFSDVRPHAGAPGTVIEVRDLFFNTPARRRFMRTAPTEFGHINETVLRAAMVHPAVGFHLTHNGRVVRDLPANQDPRARCVELIGKEVEEGLLEFQHKDTPDTPGTPGLTAHVWGLAGQPSLARSSGKFQYLYINGRPIRDRNLQHAIKEAYRGLIPSDRFPLAAVFLEIDPTQVDVNVHPAKSEVRFRNPSRWHSLVQTAIRQRLLGEDLTPSALLTNSTWPSRGASQGNGDTAPPSSDQFVEYFKSMAPQQKGMVYQQVKAAIEQDDAVDTQPLLEDARIEPTVRPQSILQVAKSYLVTEDDDGSILIIDQHALHERVMFEQLRQRVLSKNESLESQRLLMPEVMDANGKQQAILESLKPLLTRIGIEVEPIGPDAVAIQSFPSFLFDRKVEPVPFMTDLLDRVEQGDLDVKGVSDHNLEATLHEVLDMMACKAAVKAGDGMGEQELASLLKLRLEVERSSNCPHGRPTTLRLTLKDLEKQFGRT